MNKNLYILLIVFLGLATVASILNTVIRLQIGGEMFTLDSYIAWFLVIQSTGVIGSILLLRYYYQQNYHFVFFSGIVGIIANLGFATVFCVILTSGRLRSYYMPAQVVELCATTVYAAGLIFSNTRKRYWLKLTGIFALVICLVLLSAIIGNMYPKDVDLNRLLGRVVQWTPVAWSLVNIMFIMNFVGEMRALNAENNKAPTQKSLEGVFGFLAVTTCVFTIVTGTLLINESYQQLFWKNYNSDQAKQMVKLAGGVKTFSDGKGDSLHYILIKPQAYDPQKKYPLVVCLPYGGYEAGAAEILSAGVSRSTYPAFIFVPYCPDGEGWGGIPGVPSLDSLVYETISALADPGIDVKRCYVTGISRGAYGTWQFICTRPDMFAAAMPVSGAGDPKLASKIINMPIWAFHGAKDKNVPVSGSRNMIAAIKKAGGHPKYTEYPDEGHSIWDKVNETPGLWNWLFAQKRP